MLPSEHGVRSHDNQRLPPSGPDSGQASPEQAVGRAELRAGRRSLVDGELLAQGQILEGELAVAAEEDGKQAQQVKYESDHDPELWSDPPDRSITCRRTAFWRMTGSIDLDELVRRTDSPRAQLRGHRHRPPRRPGCCYCPLNPGNSTAAVDQPARVDRPPGRGALWQRLRGRPASESGRLRHGEGPRGRGARRRRVLGACLAVRFSPTRERAPLALAFLLSQTWPPRRGEAVRVLTVIATVIAISFASPAHVVASGNVGRDPTGASR
jgi:hypothetical protein